MTSSVASQGIVVGGRRAPDVRIVNNSIRGVFQGVHVGFSRRENQPGRHDQAQTVIISQNTIETFLPPPGATGERHGCFVGNCDSLLVEGNYISTRRFSSTARYPIEGVRVFGHLGKRMIVRNNHTSGFSTGIRVNPLNPLGNPSPDPLWLVADNVASVNVTNENTNIPIGQQRLRVKQSNNHA